MTEERVQALMRLVKKQLAPWLVGPEADDLLAEAYYGMWRRLANPPPGVSLGAVAVHGARWQMADYLRSHRQLVPRDRFGKGLGKMLSLDSDFEGEDANGDPWNRAPKGQAAPDFVPGLLEEIGGSDLLEAVCEGCTANQERILRRFVAGETLDAIAGDLKIHKETVRQTVVVAVSRYREKHGILGRGESLTTAARRKDPRRKKPVCSGSTG